MAEALRGHLRPRARNRNVAPRGILFINNEKKRRDVQARLYFSIAGWSRTGKRTLANRFTTLDDDEFERNQLIPRNWYYTTVNLNTRSDVNETGIVQVGMIMDRLRMEAGVDAEILMSHLHAVLFIFDVSYRHTLEMVGEMFHEYRNHEDENMLPSILVGNKIDIRDGPGQTPPRDPVSTEDGSSEARSLGALDYFECSALRNIGTDPIFGSILQLILRRSRL